MEVSLFPEFPPPRRARQAQAEGAAPSSPDTPGTARCSKLASAAGFMVYAPLEGNASLYYVEDPRVRLGATSSVLRPEIP